MISGFKGNIMKHLLGVLLLCAAAGAQGHAREGEPGQPALNSAVVVQAPGGLAVRVNGQTYYLNGALVYDAAGQRSGARLAAGMAVNFTLAGEGSSLKVKEVWTTN